MLAARQSGCKRRTINPPQSHAISNNSSITGGPLLWDSGDEPTATAELERPGESLPSPADKHDFVGEAPVRFVEVTKALPELQRLDTAIKDNANFDLFIGAMGFEERTYEGTARLVKRGVTAARALLLEFDLYYKATERRRETYEALLVQLTAGKPFRPMNAPLGTQDPLFAERMKSAIASIVGSKKPSILFDCTSCPSLILSRCLSVLLEFPCELTVLYSEAAEYFPTEGQWESGKLVGNRTPVEGPFSGVRFVEKPPLLPSDDTRERPILLVSFPTFNTERTSGALSELEPARRIWIFGEPHDLAKNSYRIEMSQAFAASVLVPGDQWSLVSTFDYRKSMETLAGIYARERSHYRLVVMPHGSKMQTIGVVAWLRPDSVLGIQGPAGISAYKWSDQYCSNPQRRRRLDDWIVCRHHCVAIAYEPGRQTLRYVVVDAAGRAETRTDIAAPHGPMVHDVGFTQNFIIVLDLPVTSQTRRSPGHAFPYFWNEQQAPRIGLFPRNGHLTGLIWFEAPACYVFHIFRSRGSCCCCLCFWFTNPRLARNQYSGQELGSTHASLRSATAKMSTSEHLCC
jgi:hypothetical protein